MVYKYQGELDTETIVLTPWDVTRFCCFVCVEIALTCIFAIIGYSNLGSEECHLFEIGTYLAVSGTLYLTFVLVKFTYGIALFLGCLREWCWAPTALMRSGAWFAVFNGGLSGYSLIFNGLECEEAEAEEYQFFFVMSKMWVLIQIVSGSFTLGMALQQFIDFTKKKRDERKG